VGGRVSPCGQKGRQASIANPIGAVRNLGNALKVRNADNDNGDRKEKWHAENSEKYAKATLAECCGLQ